MRRNENKIPVTLRIISAPRLPPAPEWFYDQNAANLFYFGNFANSDTLACRNKPGAVR